MSFELSSVADAGVLGAILAWFMFRIEKVLQENNRVLGRVMELLHLIIKK